VSVSCYGVDAFEKADAAEPRTIDGTEEERRELGGLFDRYGRSCPRARTGAEHRGVVSAVS
jgi:hypothetical protein